jgi:hypothetical protein
LNLTYLGLVYFIYKRKQISMGELVDRIGLRMLVDGDGLADNFKNNSSYNTVIRDNNMDLDGCSDINSVRSL